jgi:hypothetical protein
MNHYSIEAENDVIFLYRNGIALCCPKQQDNAQCGSWCPHFTWQTAPNSFNVRLLCVPTVQAIVIERVQNGSAM